MHHEKIIQRDSGQKVKIVALLFSPPWGSPVSISNHVLTCERGSETWSIVKNDPSKEKSPNNARNAMFNVVSIAEVLKANQELLDVAGRV